MLKILLLGAGTQALAIVKGLSRQGYELFMIVDERGNYADESKYVKQCFIYPDSVNSEGFLSFFENLIYRQCIDIVIPMGDNTAEFLSKNKDKLQNKVKFTVPSFYNFLKGYDKNKLMTLCRVKGYPHPTTIDLSNSVNLESDEFISFPYPAMLKPNCTTGGRGMVLIGSHQELLEKYPLLHEQYGDYHLQQYIHEGGRQIKLQLFVDKNGKLLAHSAMQKIRWYPVKGGSSSCSVSIEEEKMTNVCHQILKDIHWEGFADFDLIEDPQTHKLLIMEINPRLPACIGTAIHAGMDWGQIIVDYATNSDINKYDYRLGIVLRHLGFDILWFLKSNNRFHTEPSWFQLFGKNVFYQDMNGWGDIKPFFLGTFHNIRKLFDPSFKKAKSI